MAEEKMCPAEMVAKAVNEHTYSAPWEDFKADFPDLADLKIREVRVALRALAACEGEWPDTVNGSVSDAVTDWEDHNSNSSNDIPVAFLLAVAAEGEKSDE